MRLTKRFPNEQNGREREKESSQKNRIALEYNASWSLILMPDLTEEARSTLGITKRPARFPR